MDGTPTRTFRDNPDPQMTTEENQQSQVDSLYAQNEPLARQAYFTYLLSRTPSELQDLMTEKIQLGLPSGNPDQVVISNGDPVPVWAAPSGLVLPRNPGTAVVVGGVLTRVDLQVPLTTAMVDNGASMPVQTSAGAAQPGSPGTALVTGHAMTAVRYTIPAPPATQAIINNGAAVVVHDAADAAVPGSPGVAAVAAGALTNVKLTV